MIATFVATLQVSDQVSIEWRIVSLDQPTPTVNDAPWIQMLGTVISVESVTAQNQPKSLIIDYADATGQHVGQYELPPQAMPNAFIEISTLTKRGRVLGRG